MATTENLTVLFTDIVGFTERTSNQTRSQNEALLRDHDTLLRPLVKQFSGKYIKSIGDAMLITFRSATNAVFCAMAMHDALFEFNKNRVEDHQIHIRAALNTGDIRLEDGDIFGEAVNIAARLEAITPGDEIYFTESVYLSMNRAEVHADFIGNKTFKGIPDEVRVYCVPKQNKESHLCPFGGVHLDSSHAAQSLRTLSGDAVQVLHSKNKNWLIGGGVAIVLLVVIVLFSSNQSEENDEAQSNVPLVVKPKRDFIAEGEELLMDNRLTAAEQVYRDALADDPRSATSLLLEGHIRYSQKKREKAIEAYASAIEINQGMADNRMLVNNLIDALGRETKPAQALFEKYKSNEMLDALSVRTGESPYWGRQHAVKILTNLEQEERIQKIPAALLDFKEADTCERKKIAVIRLGQLKAREALPLLKPIAEAGFFDRLSESHRCLIDEAKQAVARIKRSAAKTPGTAAKNTATAPAKAVEKPVPSQKPVPKSAPKKPAPKKEEVISPFLG